MQKGKLGSIVAGILAIFLVLICLFYLSFTLVTNHYEDKAEAYAQQVSGNQTASSDSYRLAYKSYIDSISKENVWLGYTFNQVQKLGVGLGLDLKGGMNVTLQVSVPDILSSMASDPDNKLFRLALNRADSVVKATKSNDYVAVFCKEYKAVDPQGDLSVVFKEQVKRGDSPEAVEAALQKEVKDRVSSSTNVLRSRIDQFGVVAPNIQELEKDGQILLELPGVKEHDRVRDLLKSSANLEFYETMPVQEFAGAIAQLDNALRADTLGAGKGLSEYFFQLGNVGPVELGVATAMNRPAIDSLLASPQAKQLLPGNLKLAWQVKPQTVEVNDTATGATRRIDLYTLVALKTTNGKPALSGDVVTSATSDFDNMQGGNYVSMNMKPDAAKQWARITAANIEKQVAIVLDGQVYSAPRVNNVIEGGRSSITGNFTTDEAKDLANVLKSGKMAAKVDIISDTVIGPSLGQQAIEDGFMSFIVALVLLMIFMMLFYGVIPGLIANVGLIFNIFFTFGILA